MYIIWPNASQKFLKKHIFNNTLYFPGNGVVMTFEEFYDKMKARFSDEGYYLLIA